MDLNQFMQRKPVKCSKCDNQVLYLDEEGDDFVIFACPICGKRFIVNDTATEH